MDIENYLVKRALEYKYTLLSNFLYELNISSIIVVLYLVDWKYLKLEKYYQGEKEIDNSRCKERLMVNERKRIKRRRIEN